jgi:hypothetical protein
VICFIITLILIHIPMQPYHCTKEDILANVAISMMNFISFSIVKETVFYVVFCLSCIPLCRFSFGLCIICSSDCIFGIFKLVLITM